MITESQRLNNLQHPRLPLACDCSIANGQPMKAIEFLHSATTQPLLRPTLPGPAWRTASMASGEFAKREASETESPMPHWLPPAVSPVVENQKSER